MSKIFQFLQDRSHFDLFDFPMDAASLVIILHGELLRTCSSVVQEHFQGVAQAGRYLRSAGLVSPTDARKLRMT